jgi:hypothetical protein
VSVVVSALSVRRAVTVQRASSLDHSARSTWWPKRMLRSMPFSRAVSVT